MSFRIHTTSASSLYAKVLNDVEIDEELVGYDADEDTDEPRLVLVDPGNQEALVLHGGPDSWVELAFKILEARTRHFTRLQERAKLVKPWDQFEFYDLAMRDLSERPEDQARMRWLIVNDPRRATDPLLCRYADCVGMHPLAKSEDDGFDRGDEEAITCPACRKELGLPELGPTCKTCGAEEADCASDCKIAPCCCD